MRDVITVGQLAKSGRPAVANLGKNLRMSHDDGDRVSLDDLLAQLSFESVLYALCFDASPRPDDLLDALHGAMIDRMVRMVEKLQVKGADVSRLVREKDGRKRRAGAAELLRKAAAIEKAASGIVCRSAFDALTCLHLVIAHAERVEGPEFKKACDQVDVVLAEVLKAAAVGSSPSTH